MPLSAANIAGVDTYNYEVDKPESRHKLHELTGYDGYIGVALNRRPAVITERGTTETEAITLAQLFEDEGDISLQISVDTLGKGVYAGCWLVSCRLIGFTRGVAGKAEHIEYERVWQQMTVGAIT